MKISELAAKTGVTIATIRFYEKVGLLAGCSVRRSENNYRDYSQEVVQRLLDLKEVQATAGFTIAELKELVRTYDAGELTTQKETVFLQQKIDVVGKKIAELEQVQSYLRNQLALLHENCFMSQNTKNMMTNNNMNEGRTRTTRHLVDPELAAILDQIPVPVLTAETLGKIRTMSSQVSVDLSRSSDLAVSEHFIPGPEEAPDVRVLVYVPTSVQGPLPVLLWIHGGGYIMGSANADDPRVKSVVSAIGCAAVSVDYRLAPETPYPGPVEDCYVALKWLYTHADELGIDPSQIAVGGSSAGGGLAAALALLARDRGEVPLAFQCLLAPMIDDRTCTLAEPHPYTGEFVWTAEANRFGWTSLLGQEPGGPDISPYAAVARAEHLEGLPATFISVGSIDLFLEEDLEYARRLMRAGVPTELHVYPGAYHGFAMVADARVTQTAARDQLAALKRAFDPSRR